MLGFADADTFHLCRTARRWKNDAVSEARAALQCCPFRIDTIEQALRDLCDLSVVGEGYRLAYRIAADNLQLGSNVVADSCNPIELTRQEWESVATSNGADFVNIEVTCSDTAEHRGRIESRRSSIEGLEQLDWQAVVDREYHKWSRNRIVIDTANRSIDDCFEDLVRRFSLA